MANSSQEVLIRSCLISAFCAFCGKRFDWERRRWRRCCRRRRRQHRFFSSLLFICRWLLHLWLAPPGTDFKTLPLLKRFRFQQFLISRATKLSACLSSFIFSPLGSQIKVFFCFYKIPLFSGTSFSNVIRSFDQKWVSLNFKYRTIRLRTCFSIALKQCRVLVSLVKLEVADHVV